MRTRHNSPRWMRRYGAFRRVAAEQAAILAEQPFWAEVSLVVVSEEAKTYLTAQPAAERLAATVAGRGGDSTS